jgi:hypothetical protein
MRPSPVSLSDSEVPDDEEEHMNIELQATDSSESAGDKNAHDSSLAEAPASPSKSSVAESSNSNMMKEHSVPPPQRLSCRQRLGLFIGIVPVVLFSFEMVDEWCHVCLDDVEIDAYFFTAAFCGGLGSVMCGTSMDYWHARMVGGAISALGSLFTIWMLLSSISSNWGILFLFLGILGAMPGFLSYFLITILTDECFMTRSSDDDYDYDHDYAPLTLPLTETDDV